MMVDKDPIYISSDTMAAGNLESVLTYVVGGTHICQCNYNTALMYVSSRTIIRSTRTIADKDAIIQGSCENFIQDLVKVDF